MSAARVRQLMVWLLTGSPGPPHLDRSQGGCNGAASARSHGVLCLVSEQIVIDLLCQRHKNVRIMKNQH